MQNRLLLLLYGRKNEKKLQNVFKANIRNNHDTKNKRYFFVVNV